MNSIGIIVNSEKLAAQSLTHQIVSFLTKHGKKILVSGPNTEILSGITSCSMADMAKEAECIIVLGGDGTLLNCARTIGDQGIPLFGINFGQLGFLTEIEQQDVAPALEKLIAGEYRVEERIMIQAAVLREGQEVNRFFGLNDAVITKGAFARLIRFKTYVNDEFYDVFPADGLIVSTPTGSTAYSLSAGGPLVSPQLELILVTPICPHTLYARPLVIDKDSIVRVILQETPGVAEVMLTMDGQSGCYLKANDEVVIGRAPFKARFLKLNQRGFYEILRTKLKEGGNLDV